MKALFFIFLCSIISSHGFSQNTLPIKEQFDWLLYKISDPDIDDGIYEQNKFYDPGNNNYWFAEAGEGMPYIVNGWLKLFMVTGDKE